MSDTNGTDDIFLAAYSYLQAEAEELAEKKRNLAEQVRKVDARLTPLMTQIEALQRFLRAREDAEYARDPEALKRDTQRFVENGYQFRPCRDKSGWVCEVYPITANTLSYDRLYLTECMASRSYALAAAREWIAAAEEVAAQPAGEVGLGPAIDNGNGAELPF